MEQTSLFEPDKPKSRARLILRDYQQEAHDNSIRLWDGGTVGTLIRAATGTGKTPTACAIMDTWLARGDDYRCMVVSYENQLVWQFAEEIEDFLGVKPGIEMSEEAVDHLYVPPITVATRQTLAAATTPSEDDIAELRKFGVNDPGCAPGRTVRKFLKLFRDGQVDADDVRDEIRRLNAAPEAADGIWSRLHKFDWKLNWLVVLDEAHKYAANKIHTANILRWFDKNPKSRRLGITATPKRSDGVSIGSVLFPGVSIDYPLNKPGHRCAVAEGWAVSYVQRYIKVEGVDFANLKMIGKDFDEGELERQLGSEKQLAALIEPLLDMVEDRRTLIFSPGVQMAKDVARYINARSRTICTCGKMHWFPTLLIGDGAQCQQCGRMIDPADIDTRPDQPRDRAKELDGETPHAERNHIYKGHQAGVFQFLSVCGLAKEGYNDPGIACVAVFRPVSEAASSLAEQMKGRGCRPLRGLVDSSMTIEERLAAIAGSEKSACLIVDLVGITGLADCASTISIYSEGLADEIVERAKQILSEKGIDESADVQGAIDQAKREDAEARERAKKEREAAEARSKELFERRAKADARVDYTTHDIGVSGNDNYNPNAASEAQYHFMEFLGLSLRNVSLTKKQAGRIIDQIQKGTPLDQVAYSNGIDEGSWEPKGPSFKQVMALKGVPHEWVKSGADASALISAKKNIPEFESRMLEDIHKARDTERLTQIGRILVNVNKSIGLPAETYGRIVAAGKMKRAGAVHNETPPDDF